jgi:hypothetical protein
MEGLFIKRKGYKELSSKIKGKPKVIDIIKKVL